MPVEAVVSQYSPIPQAQTCMMPNFPPSSYLVLRVLVTGLKVFLVWIKDCEKRAQEGTLPAIPYLVLEFVPVAAKKSVPRDFPCLPCFPLVLVFKGPDAEFRFFRFFCFRGLQNWQYEKELQS